MKTNIITIGSLQVAEIISDAVLIQDTQDVLDLMGEVQADAYIFRDYNFEPDFFDLSTKKLGEVLQKFTNYRIKVAIIGDFDKYPSAVLKDFIYETNRQGDYLFVSSLEDGIKRWQDIH